MTYKRNCPQCGQEIEYKNPRSFKWASRDNTICRKCYSKKISTTIQKLYDSGEFPFVARDKTREVDLIRNFHRTCPDCGGEMGYVTKWGMDNAENRGVVCNSCSSYKYHKTFNEVIKPEHILQMRATKAGFADFNEYTEKYPAKKFYKQEVWRHTYRQPLHTLENWDKRGKCGVEGAYQLDHMQSITYGWDNHIPAEEIARWENLRMIPWLENLLKSSK